MRLQSIKHIGVAVTIIGTLLVIGPSAGFSSLEADRGIGVQTAADPDAYLGIESEGDVTGTELRGNSDPLTVGTLTNNVSETLEVRDVSVASIGDDSVDDTIVAVASPDAGDTIETGSSSGVTVECADDQSVGEREVTFRVDRVEGESISIAGPRFNTTVDIQCGKGKFSGSAGLTVSDVATDSTTQNVSFDVSSLGNNDQATVNVSRPQSSGGVDYSSVTTEDVTVQTQHNGELTFDPDSSQLTYSSQGNGGQGNSEREITIRIENIDVTGSSGESYQVDYSDTTGREEGDFFDIT